MFKKIKKTIFKSSISKEYYAIAEKEIVSGDLDEGLWAKALVKAKGDEKRRKAEYIQIRAEALAEQYKEDPAETYKEDLNFDSSEAEEIDYGIDKDALYLQATEEADEERQEKSLWARCLALSKGDKQKARYNYINERVNKLYLEEKERIKEEIRQRKRIKEKARQAQIKQRKIEKIKSKHKMEFVWIKPDSFMMGSPENEANRNNDEKLHHVKLTKGFYMQTTQVTRGQWKALMKSKPLYFSSLKGNYPIKNVSWYEAKEFIKKLNDMDRTRVYRLPTEAEWEYACRAGNSTPFNTGNTLRKNQAHYNSWFAGRPTSVASFPPNAFGLYDMHGNVWEWCEDWYDEYPDEDQIDPKGPLSGSGRIIRGGTWNTDAYLCRSGYRNYLSPEDKNNTVGFRLVYTEA